MLRLFDIVRFRPVSFSVDPHFSLRPQVRPSSGLNIGPARVDISPSWLRCCCAALRCVALPVALLSARTPDRRPAPRVVRATPQQRTADLVRCGALAAACFFGRAVIAHRAADMFLIRFYCVFRVCTCRRGCFVARLTTAHTRCWPPTKADPNSILLFPPAPNHMASSSFQQMAMNMEKMLESYKPLIDATIEKWLPKGGCHAGSEGEVGEGEREASG